MKKLFSLAVAFVVLFALASCAPRSEEEQDDQFTIEVRGTETTSGHFAYDASKEALLFETLKTHFDVEYTEFDFGVMLSSIDTLSTPYGSFIQILHNNELAQVGVSDVVVKAGDTVVFERAWFDDTARGVYDALYNFIDQHQASYANEETQHPYVYAGLALLEKTVLPSVNTDAIESSGARINAVLAARSIGQDTDDLQATLYDEKTISWPYATGLSILALLDYEASIEDFVLDFKDDLEGRNLETIDVDTLAIALLALEAATITFDFDSEVLRDDLVSAIQSGLYTSSFGDNAATFAHAIIALIAVGEDPRDSVYEDDEGIHLVDRFLSFEAANGAFYYQDDDEHPDLMFSTPQAFLAIASLHTYFNTNEPIHPFLYD